MTTVKDQRFTEERRCLGCGETGHVVAECRPLNSFWNGIIGAHAAAQRAVAVSAERV